MTLHSYSIQFQTPHKSFVEMQPVPEDRYSHNGNWGFCFNSCHKTCVVKWGSSYWLLFCIFGSEIIDLGALFIHIRDMLSLKNLILCQLSEVFYFLGEPRLSVKELL